jgi:hypothetical protein
MIVPVMTDVFIFIMRVYKFNKVIALFNILSSYTIKMYFHEYSLIIISTQ